VAVAPLPGQQTRLRSSVFLRQSIGLDSAQLAAVERGTAVVKVSTPRTSGDVAVFGIITADVPGSCTSPACRFPELAGYTDPHPLRHLSATPRPGGRYAGPGGRPGDVSEVKDCHPNACKIKLPATDMKRFREEIDGQGPIRRCR